MTFLITMCFMLCVLQVLGFRLFTFKIERSHNGNLQGRTIGPSADLNNVQQTLYTINTTMGTPGQIITFQLTTTHGSTWIPVSGSTVCLQNSSQCGPHEAFQPSLSSTYLISDPKKYYNFEFDGATWLEGNRAEDKITIGGVDAGEIQFGAATMGHIQSRLVPGVMGLGFGDSTQDEPNNAVASNLITNLEAMNITRTRAYSLWLNHAESTEGNILFGGVDVDKFLAPLMTIPMIPDSDGLYRSISIPLTHISLKMAVEATPYVFTSTNYIGAAIIAPDAPLIYLPTDIVERIWTQTSAYVKDGKGYLPCDLSYPSGNDPSDDNARFLTFRFNGNSQTDIDIPLNSLLFPTSIKGSDPTLPLCYFALGTTQESDGKIYLGEAFMRAAYVVFDLSNHFISLARATFDTSF